MYGVVLQLLPEDSFHALPYLNSIISCASSAILATASLDL